MIKKITLLSLIALPLTTTIVSCSNTEKDTNREEIKEEPTKEETNETNKDEINKLKEEIKSLSNKETTLNKEITDLKNKIHSLNIENQNFELLEENLHWLSIYEKDIYIKYFKGE